MPVKAETMHNPKCHQADCPTRRCRNTKPQDTWLFDK